MASLLEPDGGPEQKFALMMHERIVRLEEEVRALRPARLDGRVTILGTATEADTGAVFVRALAPAAVDTDAWAAALLGTLGARDPRGGGGLRYDLWCCQHFSCLAGTASQPYVVEALVQRSGHRPQNVAAVAHAALDALECPSVAAVEAAAAVNADWFVESIRAAAAASPGTTGARMHTWDPRARCVMASDADDHDHDHDHDQDQDDRGVWMRLHGWLASQTERADMWHPHAPSAPKLGADLLAMLARQM